MMALVASSLRVLAGVLFTAAGAGKLLSERAVKVAPMILGDVSGPIMVASMVLEDAVPALEVLVGLALIAGIGRLVTNLIALALGALFVVAACLVPEGVRCGCLGIFGAFESRGAHLAASGGIVAVMAAVIAAESLFGRRSHKARDSNGL